MGQIQLTSDRKRTDFRNIYTKMLLHLAIERIALLILIFLVICNSKSNEILDWSQIVTKNGSIPYNISRCVSYRQVPCQLEITTDSVFLEDIETFLKLEKQCLVYRYIPCQEGWSVLTTVYENGEDFLQRQNVRMIEKSWQCRMEQVREKNEFAVSLKSLNEETQHVDFNLTECVLEIRNQSLVFESQMENCQTSNKTLQEKMGYSEANKTNLKLDWDWCLSGGGNKTSLIQAELQECQHINSLLNEENLLCNSEKMETEANYITCMIEEKQESMQFNIDFQNCLYLRDSIKVRVLSCNAENKDKELELIDCRDDAKENTLFYDTELEKCQNSNNSSNEKWLTCKTKQAKLQSNLTLCLSKGKKNTLKLKNEVEIYQALNSSLYEKILDCETEKNYTLSNVAECSDDILSRTLGLESKLNQLQEKKTMLNKKILSCDAELTRAKFNITECCNKGNRITFWFETEMKNCQDAHFSIREEIVTCETEKKQAQVNLTRCLIETENTTVEWFTIEGKKFELLTDTFNDTAFACSIEKKKLESNLANCFIDFKKKILSLQAEIINYISWNNTLSEKIVACNIEKAELATQVNGCLLQASNLTKLLEATVNQYQNLNYVLYENVTSCDKEKTKIMLMLTVCLNEEQKRDVSPAERWNREKNLLIDYMASWWTQTSFPILKNVPIYDSINEYIRYNVVRLELSPLATEEKLMPEYGAVINDVISFGYFLDIPACSIVPPTIRSIFIAVITSAPNFEQRKQIRFNFVIYIKAIVQRDPPIAIHFGFFMGMPNDSSLQTEIEQESFLFGDIIQIEMDDINRNSPMKMAAVLNWVDRNCATVDLMIKMEEETKINIYSMVNFVNIWYTATGSMFGKSQSTAPSRVGQKNITMQEYPWNNYPDYFDGSTYYILHGTTIRPILAAMQTTPFFPLEDVYVTGICRVKAGVKRLICTQNDRPEVCFA